MVESIISLKPQEQRTIIENDLNFITNYQNEKKKKVFSFQLNFVL